MSVDQMKKRKRQKKGTESEKFCLMKEQIIDSMENINQITEIVSLSTLIKSANFVNFSCYASSPETTVSGFRFDDGIIKICLSPVGLRNCLSTTFGSDQSPVKPFSFLTLKRFSVALFSFIIFLFSGFFSVYIECQSRRERIKKNKLIELRMALVVVREGKWKRQRKRKRARLERKGK